MKFDQVISNSRPRTLILLAIYFVLIISSNWIIPLFYGETWPYGVIMFFYIIVYLIVALLIWEERYFLYDNHVEKWSLVIFLVFGSFLRSGKTSNLPYFLLFYLIAMVLFYALRKVKVKIPKANALGFWLLIGLGCAVGEFIIIYSLLSNNIIESTSTLLYKVLSPFLYELGNRAIHEEFVFRGFLWGVMRRSGYLEKQILLIQAILFTLCHINLYDLRGFMSYCGLLGSSLLLGYLAYKSHSLVPGTILHAFHNAFVTIFR